jgi:energy-coupling factor transporter ATP-binding protein EcfA2
VLPGGAQRVLVYGVTGSGKSTLARKLGDITGIPYHPIDDLTWEPGWIQVPKDEQRRRISEVCAGEEWIIDSGYGSWLEIPLSRADLIVGLDFPRWFSLQRLIRRSLFRIVDRKPICNGNRESVRTLCSPGSIIVWHFRSFARKRERIRKWAADPAIPVVRLTSAHQTEAWVEGLRRAAAVTGSGEAGHYYDGA